MINDGDTGFVLISAALVMVMTPGLAFFYGGLVRRKNFLTIMLQSFISMGVVTVLWVLVGYSLAFSGNEGGIIGNFSWVLLKACGPAPRALGAPHPGLRPLRVPGDVRHHHPGAHHRRVRRPDRLQELPQVPRRVEPHRLRTDRALDLGRRLPHEVGRARTSPAAWSCTRAPASPPWLRYSWWVPGSSPRARRRSPTTSPSWASAPACCGSAGSASTPARRWPPTAVAAQAFVNTDIAASVAMCTWLAVSWWRSGKPSIVGAFTGAVAGLACVTPCAGFVPTWAAFFIGLLAGSICYAAVAFVRHMKWDDALDVWAAHGVGGLLGSILVGVFAYESVNVAGGNGLIAGHPALFGKQVAAAIFIAVYAFVVTWVILKVLDKFEPIRVPDAVELAGLDTELEEPDAYVFS